MTENVLTDSLDGLLRTTVTSATETVYFVGPSHRAIEDLVTVLTDVESAPTVRLLSAERVVKDVMADFLVASRAASLVADGDLAIRVAADDPENALLVTESAVYAVVTLEGRVACLATGEREFVRGARDRYDDAWSDADSFELRTPPLDEVRETLASDIGPETAADFDSVLGSLQTARGDGDGLDEVTVSILVAARNGELLYDISKWGEDIGLASKATFSRTKTKLEDMGLVDTEKVPIDVGRPRLRLMLGDDRLDDADADQIASVAQSLLAS
ncbi:MAG: transcriptional regulator TbsP [Halorientalis sp.]